MTIQVRNIICKITSTNTKLNGHKDAPSYKYKQLTRCEIGQIKKKDRAVNVFPTSAFDKTLHFASKGNSFRASLDEMFLSTATKNFIILTS